MYIYNIYLNDNTIIPTSCHHFGWIYLVLGLIHDIIAMASTGPSYAFSIQSISKDQSDHY